MVLLRLKVRDNISEKINKSIGIMNYTQQKEYFDKRRNIFNNWRKNRKKDLRNSKIERRMKGNLQKITGFSALN